MKVTRLELEGRVQSIKTLKKLQLPPDMLQLALALEDSYGYPGVTFRIIHEPERRD